MKLFLYGTLLDEDIAVVVCGVPLVGDVATLSGYRCRNLVNEVYPGIIPHEGEVVAGRLCHDVSPAIVQQLDDYEGPQYVRHQVKVEIVGGEPVIAQAYVLAPAHEHELGSDEWNLEVFVRRDKAEFLGAI